MTYEEKLVDHAEKVCDKFYVSELAVAFVSVIFMTIWVFTFNKWFGCISFFGYAVCIIIEVTESKYRKHVNNYIDKRLEILNESLYKAIDGISCSDLKRELKLFKEEYGFLEDNE